MRIHNDSLLRVVFTARVAGVLLALGGAGLAALPIISAIRHHAESIPWSKTSTGLLSGIVPGIALLICATLLDRGRIWAYYAISAITAVEVLLVGTMVAATMNVRAAVLLLPVLALAVACGIAWHPAQSQRRANARAYKPLKPIASTAVVIPPPPTRKMDARSMQAQVAPETPGAMVIEIRRT